MERLYLIARVADETIALPAGEIQSVVEVHDIAAIPRAPDHVAGLFALRSRVLTVIDSQRALGLGTHAQGEGPAVIVEVDGHSYALLVDQVDDVIEAPAPEPCPAVLGPSWRRAARGSIVREEGAVLLLDPARIVAGPDPAAPR
jgi:purine-binding chemotaxis protein CheW